MSLSVNEEQIPEELIQQEMERLVKLPGFQSITDDVEREARVREMAEIASVDRVVIRQIADNDARPLDEDSIQEALDRYRDQTGCSVGVNGAAIRTLIEQQLRFQRTVRDLTGQVPDPDSTAVLDFFEQNLHNFVEQETVTAAHIVVNVDAVRSEQEAHLLIEEAARELEAGGAFATVVERYSDCKGNGGELEPFPRGVMVQEFEDVVFALSPGTRSGIFRTPLGFHIAEARGRTATGSKVFEKVKPDITQFFKTRDEQQRLHRALAYLRLNSVISRTPATESVHI